jgi:hypothetical protein
MIRSTGGRRRLAVALAVIGLIVVIVLGAAGYALWRFNQPNESERYRDLIALKGYQQVRAGYSQGAFAFYVGPVVDDPGLLALVSRPDLAVRPQGTAVGTQHDVGWGSGRLDGKMPCAVRVIRLDPGDATAEYLGNGTMSKEQSDGVRSGSLEAVEITVLCDAQAVP